MIAAGIVDPTKVTRSALENAASIAAMRADHRVSGGRQARASRRRRSRRCPTWAACTNSYGLKGTISAPTERAGALCVLNAYF